MYKNVQNVFKLYGFNLAQIVMLCEICIEVIGIVI